MSDDIKKAAEAVVAIGEKPLWGATDRELVLMTDRLQFARAYLALREQVETVALPALREARVAMKDRRFYAPGFFRDQHRARWDAEDTYIDAAIKAIEEGHETI